MPPLPRYALAPPNHDTRWLLHPIGQQTLRLRNSSEYCRDTQQFHSTTIKGGSISGTTANWRWDWFPLLRLLLLLLLSMCCLLLRLPQRKRGRGRRRGETKTGGSSHDTLHNHTLLPVVLWWVAASKLRKATWVHGSGSERWWAEAATATNDASVLRLTAIKKRQHSAHKTTAYRSEWPLLRLADHRYTGGRPADSRMIAGHGKYGALIDEALPFDCEHQYKFLSDYIFTNETK